MTRIAVPTGLVNEGGPIGVGHNSEQSVDERRARLEAALLTYCSEQRIEAALQGDELLQLDRTVQLLALRNNRLAGGLRLAHLEPNYDAVLVVADFVFALADMYDGVCKYSATAIGYALRRKPDTVRSYFNRLVGAGLISRIDHGPGIAPWYRPVIVEAFVGRISPTWMLDTFKGGRHVNLHAPMERLAPADRYPPNPPAMAMGPPSGDNRRHKNQRNK